MAKTTTRRAVLAGTGAGTIAAAIASSAAALAQPPEIPINLDAELFALDQPYQRTYAAWEALSDAHTAAEGRHLDLRTARPGDDDQILRDESGLTEAERVYYAALRANNDVILEIAAYRARTIEGVIYKARLSERWDNYIPELIDSITADLVAMGAANA